MQKPKVDGKRKKIIDRLCSRIEDKASSVSFLELYLTTRCHLNCRYCAMGKAGKEMALSIVKETIDFLLSTREKKVTLQFFGGEPLFRWPLIKQGVAYLEKQALLRKKEVRIGIATDGILLGSDKIDFFSKRDSYIVFSLDGPEKIQHLNRPAYRQSLRGKFHRVIEDNLITLSRSGVPYFVNMIVGPDNIAQMESSVYYLARKGIRHIRLSYMMGVYWEERIRRIYLRKVRNLYWKCLLLRPSVFIQHCTDEPVLVSSGLAVTPDRKLMVGTTLPLKNRFSNLMKINGYGRLSDYKGIHEIKRNKRHEVRRALELSLPSRHEFDLMASNLQMGISYKQLFEDLSRESSRYQKQLSREIVIGFT